MMANPGILFAPTPDFGPDAAIATNSAAAWQENAARRNARFAAMTTNVSEDDGRLLQPSKKDSDKALQEDLLVEYNCDNEDPASFDEQKITTSRQSGSKVFIKRTLRSHQQEAGEVEREINILCSIIDPSIPFLLESLELKDVVWTVKEYRPVQTIGQLVELNGPMSEEVLKTSLNQLFAGIASLFLGGFAHLRICDSTVCMDHDGQLMITDFKYACEFGKERTETVYAPTQEKYGDDIYVAPEIYAQNTYNARKAVMWSCGVLIYFMITAQTAKLSNIGHPSFETSTSSSSSQPSQPEPSTPSPRRNSLFSSHRRRSSTTSPALSQRIIHYPNNRFEIPNYVRWTMPRMLQPDPVKRAELIEICSRVPKESDSKDARTLMEIAWLDYKTHVGPYAGLQNLGAGPAEGWSDGASIRDGAASSIYSVASNFSNPFGSLLGKKDVRVTTRPVGVSRW